jgi:hypothetical protein
MPENFSSILTALSDEARERAHTLPAAVVGELGRAGQRRRRWRTAAFSTAAVLAVAIGGAVALAPARGDRSVAPAISTGPLTSDHPTPGHPTPGHPTPPAVDAKPFMLGTDLPNPGTFQWKRDGVFDGAGGALGFGSCGRFGPGDTLNAKSATAAQYKSFVSNENAFETIYQYDSAAAAVQDYNGLIPTTCGTQSGHITDGFAWHGTGGAADHVMVVRAGSSIALFHYIGSGPAVYDPSDDQLALQRMADRLNGRTPVPAKNTAPPPGMIPDSAWLDPAQIPFATADKSVNGWVAMSPIPQQTDDPAPDDLCSAGGLVGGGATVEGRMYHGSPTTVPADSRNILYSSAGEQIETFSGPSAAQAAQAAQAAEAAFERAKPVMTLHGCSFKDASGDQVKRTITAGAVTATGFSIVEDDTPTWHTHVYVVVKGDHVATLTVSFEKAGGATADDASVLNAIAARLP